MDNNLIKRQQTCNQINNYDINVLALTTLYEAADQGHIGYQGVTNVIINRMANLDLSAETIVCQEWQFECYQWSFDQLNNFYKNNKYVLPLIIKAIEEIIQNEKKGIKSDNTNGANMYNNPSKENADWVTRVQKQIEIKDHTFYLEENQNWLRTKPVDQQRLSNLRKIIQII